MILYKYRIYILQEKVIKQEQAVLLKLDQP